MKIRLDKMLSHLGYGSRKEIKSVLKKYEVLVNDKRVKDGKVIVDITADCVRMEGEEIIYEEFVYYMMHKPKGVISATEDGRDETVIDLIDSEDYRPDIFPVGRLDKDTTGLLLITNDGKLAHSLLSPKKKVPKCYWSQVKGIVTEEDVQLFAKGFEIDGEEWVKPSQLVIEKIDVEKNLSEIRLTIIEGKFHQVKRMMATVGKEVLELHRETMGGLSLDKSLKVGAYRKVTKEELSVLKK